MKKNLRFLFVALMAMIGINANAAWEKATSIAVGDVVVLAIDNGSVTKELSAITTSGTTIGQVADYDGTPAGLMPLTVVAGSQDGTLAFKTAGDAYLSWKSGSGNSLTTAEEINDASSWTVTADNGVFIITNVGTTARILQYNASNPRFACYGNSNQTKPNFWKKAADGAVVPPVFNPSGKSFTEAFTVEITAEEGVTIYYTLDNSEPSYTDAENFNGVVYNAAIEVQQTTTIKAIAVKGGVASSVASETYTKLEVITIAQAQAAAQNESVLIEGTVVASAANGAVIYDGTDYIYQYNTANKLAVGQKVRMQGALGMYGGAKQLTSSATITELGTENVTHPEATALTTADFEGYVTEKATPRKYVTFDGTLSINGNYFNLAIEGTEAALGSLVKPNEDLSELNGKKVTVTGYMMYVNSKYVYIVATEVKEAASGEEPVDENIKSWDFTVWSEATIANLKAEAAKVTVEDDATKAETTKATDNGALWSDHEKATQCTTYAASKDNCFWCIATPDADGSLSANGVVIAELKGLKFNSTYSTARSLAIAVNYPSTSLGTYAGPAYLWLGGKEKLCFTIPEVAAGSTITIEAESHNPENARGVQLKQGSTQIGDDFKPTTKDSYSWTVETAGDVDVYNTNGCHIYKLIVSATTGISNVQTRTADNGAIFNLAGQKVGAGFKGIAIINGKKVVLK